MSSEKECLKKFSNFALATLVRNLVCFWPWFKIWMLCGLPDKTDYIWSTLQLQVIHTSNLPTIKSKLVLAFAIQKFTLAIQVIAIFYANCTAKPSALTIFIWIFGHNIGGACILLVLVNYAKLKPVKVLVTLPTYLQLFLT